MKIAETWFSLRLSTVETIARLLRVQPWVADEPQYEATPYATDTQSRLIRGSLDAMVAAVWPIAVTDFKSAQETCSVLLMHLVVVLEVPLAAIAYELSELLRDMFDEDDDVTATDFLGADIFTGIEPGPGQISIREEIHAFIAESLEYSPEGAVQVVRTFAERWPDDEVTAAEHVANLVAHLLTSLAHRAATDAILEGADEAG